MFAAAALCAGLALPAQAQDRTRVCYYAGEAGLACGPSFSGLAHRESRANKTRTQGDSVSVWSHRTPGPAAMDSSSDWRPRAATYRSGSARLLGGPDREVEVYRTQRAAPTHDGSDDRYAPARVYGDRAHDSAQSEARYRGETGHARQRYSAESEGEVRLDVSGWSGGVGGAAVYYPAYRGGVIVLTRQARPAARARELNARAVRASAHIRAARD